MLRANIKFTTTLESTELEGGQNVFLTINGHKFQRSVITEEILPGQLLMALVVDDTGEGNAIYLEVDPEKNQLKISMLHPGAKIIYCMPVDQTVLEEVARTSKEAEDYFFSIRVPTAGLTDPHKTSNFSFTIAVPSDLLRELNESKSLQLAPQESQSELPVADGSGRLLGDSLAQVGIISASQPPAVEPCNSGYVSLNVEPANQEDSAKDVDCWAALSHIKKLICG